MNIHVGNLAREVAEDELRRTFEAFGQVTAVNIITDRSSGVSRGFGFVEMPDKAEAQAAIAGLHMKELGGRTLDISEARPPRAAGARGNRSPVGGGYRPSYGGTRARPGYGGRSGGPTGGRRRSF